MTHFRNNPKVLQNLLEFRYAKGLPLFNNIPDYVVSEDEITSVAYMDQAALKNYADRLLKSKIQIESKFTLLFFEITKDLYAHYKLEMDLTAAESKATYEEIKKYVAEHNDGMKVSNLYIAQVKRKCGIEVGENFNLPKSEDSRQPQCPKEKEDAIVEALKAFRMI